MKLKYSLPLISVEVLDKTDVLLSSVEVVQKSTKKEKENFYRDFVDFIFSEDLFD